MDGTVHIVGGYSAYVGCSHQYFFLLLVYDKLDATPQRPWVSFWSETLVMEYFLIFLSVLQDNSTTTEDRPMTHWIPWLTIHSLAEDWRFDRYGIPMELYKLIQLVH